MTSTRKAYFVGGGIGSLAGAAFMIRDGGWAGDQIAILEAGAVMGGSLDGAGDADRGHTMRGGRMLTTDNYECTAAELLEELCGHLRFDLDAVATANCIPCRMPYITSMFMPRAPGDRPLPVPEGTKNFAFISQFVEIQQDTVFTVEFSVRVAQMAMYQLLGLTQPIPPFAPHDKSLHAQFDALVKALQ